MGPPSYMQSIINRRMTVLAGTAYIYILQVYTMCVIRVNEQDKLSLTVMLIFK
jgi:hypothetical protein